MKTKRGSEKYYIIISLILGLIILGLSLYFIFHEYFTSKDIDWEVCRQSVVMRNAAPNFPFIEDAKDLFPLKCKTQVINIDYQNLKRFAKQKEEIRRSCWYLVGNGNYSIYPSGLLLDTSICFVCARIHFDDKVKDHYPSGISSEDILITLNFVQTGKWSKFINKIPGIKQLGNYLYGRDLQGVDVSLIELSPKQLADLGCQVTTIPA